MASIATLTNQITSPVRISKKIIRPLLSGISGAYHRYLLIHFQCFPVFVITTVQTNPMGGF
jgi:hypothetical protein